MRRGIVAGVAAAVALAVSAAVVAVSDPVPATAQAWIDDPANGAVVALGPVAVVAHATDPDGLRRVELVVDGILVGTANGGDGLVTARWTWTPTAAGEHDLVVRGVGGSTTDSEHLVAFVGGAPTDTTAAPTTTGPSGTTTSTSSPSTTGPTIVPATTTATTTPRTTVPATTTPRTTVPSSTTPATTTPRTTVPSTTTTPPTTAPCTIGTPGSLSPAGGAAVGERTPTLSWAAPPGCPPTGYHIEVSRDPGFARLELPQGSSTTAQWTVSSALTNCITFYWRVRTVVGRTVGPWSSTASFHTDFGGCP